MPNFIYDFTLLSGSKSDLIPLAGGDDRSKYNTADGDWNPLISAVNDSRMHMLSGSFVGFAHLTGGLGAGQKPSVSGSQNFVFLSSSGDWYFHRAGGGDYKVVSGTMTGLSSSYAFGATEGDQTINVLASRGGAVRITTGPGYSGPTLRITDPSDSDTYLNWNNTGSQIMRSGVVNAGTNVGILMDTKNRLTANTFLLMVANKGTASFAVTPGGDLQVSSSFGMALWDYASGFALGYKGFDLTVYGTGGIGPDSDLSTKTVGSQVYRWSAGYFTNIVSHTSSLFLTSSVNQLPGDNPNHVVVGANSFAADQAAKLVDFRLAGTRLGYIDHSGSNAALHHMSLQVTEPSGTFGIGATGSYAVRGGDEGGLIDLDSAGNHFPNTTVPFFSVTFVKPYPTGSQVFVTISPADSATAAQAFGGAGTRALYVSASNTQFGVGTSLAVGSPINWFINYTVKCVTPR